MKINIRNEIPCIKKYYNTSGINQDELQTNKHQH